MPQVLLPRRFQWQVTPNDIDQGRIFQSFGPHPRTRYGVAGLGFSAATAPPCSNCGAFPPALSALGPMGPAEFFGGRTMDNTGTVTVNPNNTPIPDYYYAAAQAAAAAGTSWALLTSGAGDVVYVNPDGTIARTWNPLKMWIDGCPYSAGCPDPALRDSHFVSPGSTAWGQQLVRIGFAQSTEQYNAQLAAAIAYAAQAAATVAAQQPAATTPAPTTTAPGTTTPTATPTVTPTVQLTNLTRAGMAGFYVGDQFRLQIVTMPGAAITATSTQNGSVIGTQAAMGQADVNGIFTIQGTMSTNELGQWQEAWYSNGIQATPVLQFTVSQIPTAQPSGAPAGTGAPTGTTTTPAGTTQTQQYPYSGQVPTTQTPAPAASQNILGIDPKYLIYGGVGLVVLMLLTSRR